VAGPAGDGRQVHKSDIYIYMYDIHMDVYIYVCIYIYVYVYLYVCMCVCVCVCVCQCNDQCMCVCVFISKPVMAVRYISRIYICVKSVCVPRDRSIDLKID